ncbi:hypothetical protein IQ07DRAFT_590243 [Pyrenochaeta sp. DS3sAY3a]|nr:hypothetical protein IQ07DRAFT_590243 [Pyrenochaeta sp. DS3sAY3a]
MMRANLSQQPSTEPVRFQFRLPILDTAHTTLAFSIPALPNMGLTFLPRPPPSRPLKRSRAAADIDGEHSSMQKKKRRLRLFLITSRLSPQFSHPATNIVDRGSSKIAVWAKQRALGRNLLRKAAILNRIRRRAVSAREAEEGHGRVLVEQEREQEEMELARLEFNQGSIDTYTRPVRSVNPSVPPTAAVRTGGHFVLSGSPSSSPSSSRSPSPTPPSPPLNGQSDEAVPSYRSPNEAFAFPSGGQIPRAREYLPLPPSPLGLSNYDAFDNDESTPDTYAFLDDEDDDEPIPNPYDDDDDDDVPFSPSAVTTISTSTVQTGTTSILQTPPQPVFSEFSILDPLEPVFGDYDQVDEGASAVWPSSFAQEAVSPTLGSTSPDFPALFTTATSPTTKRTDSFALSPNFRPVVPAKSISPNFPPSTTTSASQSPNFRPAASSPNFAASTVPMSASPNFVSSPGFSKGPPAMSLNFTVPPTSPNFIALAAPSPQDRSFRNRPTTGSSQLDVPAPKKSDSRPGRKK